jgi:hypothetical protein
MAESIHLAEKYSSKVAERFKMKSLATGFTNRDYDWDGVKTINVYSIPTVPLYDYNRNGKVYQVGAESTDPNTSPAGNDGISRYGQLNDLQDAVQPLTVTQDKSFTFIIDKGDKMDSMNVRDAGKALRREIDEVIVPTQDKYTFNKIATAATGTQRGTGSLSKTNAYEKFLAGQTALDNALVPSAGRIAAVNASTLALLKQDNSFVLASEIGQKMKINGLVGELDGVKIVKVPDSYLPTGCQFIITHPSVTVKAEKLADYKIHVNPPFISGNLVEGRVYYDAFVLNAKKDGIYAHFTA